MRTGLPAGTALLALLFFSASVRAQPPAPVADPAASAVPVHVPAVPVEDVAPGRETEALISLDIMIGQQMGIRPQVALYRADHMAVVAEGLYGALLSKLGSSEAAGGGGRVLFRHSSEHSTNSLLFGPGVDLLFQLNGDAVVMLAPTVDLAWLHGFGGRGGWETGINAGIGVGLSGRGYHDKDAAGQVTPLISVYTGFRY